MGPKGRRTTSFVAPRAEQNASGSPGFRQRSLRGARRAGDIDSDVARAAIANESDGEKWLYTGDLGYTITNEADGRREVFICGRLKDMIIVRGRNFYPSDLEWVVSEMPGVRRGNVVAFSAEIDGEEQLVITAEGMSSEAETLKTAIAQRIVADFALTPHEVVIVPQGTLPRTSSGKPQRRKTRQMYLDDTLARARTVQGASGEPEDAGAGA